MWLSLEVTEDIHTIWLVVCRLGLEALSQPKPALESQAEPKPCWELHGAYGSDFNFLKPEPRAWAEAFEILNDGGFCGVWIEINCDKYGWFQFLHSHNTSLSPLGSMNVQDVLKGKYFIYNDLTTCVITSFIPFRSLHTQTHCHLASPLQ